MSAASWNESWRLGIRLLGWYFSGALIQLVSHLRPCGFDWNLAAMFDRLGPKSAMALSRTEAGNPLGS